MDTDQEARGRRHGLVGLLARPAQHEINNLLTVVFANLDLLRRSAAEGAPRRQLDRIAEAARRLETSTRAVLSFARRPPKEDAPFAPMAVLEQIKPLLSLLLPTPGAVVLEPGPAEAVQAFGDRAALENMLIACAAAGAGEGRLKVAVTGTTDGVDIRLELGAAPSAMLAALAPATADADGVVTLRYPRAAPTAGG